MAVFGGMGMLIKYDKKSLRPFGYVPPPPPRPLSRWSTPNIWPVIPMRPIIVVIHAVCQHFGITPIQLKQRRRLKLVAYRRHLAMYLCREHTADSFPEIGRVFGGYDHTTVMHGAQRIERLITADNGWVKMDLALIIAIIESQTATATKDELT